MPHSRPKTAIKKKKSSVSFVSPEEFKKKFGARGGGKQEVGEKAEDFEKRVPKEQGRIVEGRKDTSQIGEERLGQINPLEKPDVAAQLFSTFPQDAPINVLSNRESTASERFLALLKLTPTTIPSGLNLTQTLKLKTSLGNAENLSNIGVQTLKTKGLNFKSVQSIAFGNKIFPSKIAKEVERIQINQIAMNAINAAKTVSIFAKVASFSKKHQFWILGALTTYAFTTNLGFNDRANGAVTQSVLARDAEVAFRITGDIENYQVQVESLERIEELANAHKEMEAWLPFINYPISAVGATLDSVDSIRAGVGRSDRLIEKDHE